MFKNYSIGDRLKAIDDGVWAKCVVTEQCGKTITVSFFPWPHDHDRRIAFKQMREETCLEQDRKHKEMLYLKVNSFSFTFLIVKNQA